MARRETTTIAIMPATRKQLELTGHKGETYDDIILRLIEEYKKKR